MTEKSKNTANFSMSYEDDWIDEDDAPELTETDFKRPDLVWSIGDKQLSETEGKAAFKAALKEQIEDETVVLDSEIIDWFKRKADGKNYKTYINNYLKELVRRDNYAHSTAL